MLLKQKINQFKQCGISPAHIAGTAGISKATISAWLNGNRENISDETKDKIETAMREIADELNAIVYEGSYRGEYDDDF